MAEVAVVATAGPVGVRPGVPLTAVITEAKATRATIPTRPSTIARRRADRAGADLGTGSTPAGGSVAIPHTGRPATHLSDRARFGRRRPGGETARPAAGAVTRRLLAQLEPRRSGSSDSAETFRAGHDPDAVSIFPSGARFAGIDAIMTALTGHFQNREALWSWTEINRRVDDCRTAFIEYEAVYEIPRIGFYQRALTVVSYVYEQGHWLSIMDQGTMLELRTGPAAG